MFENNYIQQSTPFQPVIIDEMRFLHSCINTIWSGEVIKQSDNYYYPNSIARLKEKYGKEIKIKICSSCEHYRVLSKKRCMIIYKQEGVEILNDMEKANIMSNGMFPIVDGLSCRYNGCKKQTFSGTTYEANLICYIEE